jgi:hypothetical protein
MPPTFPIIALPLNLYQGDQGQWSDMAEMAEIQVGK